MEFNTDTWDDGIHHIKLNWINGKYKIATSIPPILESLTAYYESTDRNLEFNSFKSKRDGLMT